MAQDTGKSAPTAEKKPAKRTISEIRDSKKSGATEHLGQQHAENREASDPDDRGDQPQQDCAGNPATQPPRQLPQAPVEIHQRTFCSELAPRSASLSVRGSSTSIGRCSVGRGVAVTMLTPFGA